MSHKSKEEYRESWKERYPSRNRVGAEDGISDEALLQRLSGLDSEAFLAEVAEVDGARKTAADGRGTDTSAAEIHTRFTYRMHDLNFPIPKRPLPDDKEHCGPLESWDHETI